MGSFIIAVMPERRFNVFRFDLELTGSMLASGLQEEREFQ